MYSSRSGAMRRRMIAGLSAAECECITTPLGYAGAIFSAVWSADVVAPPTMTGVAIPLRCSSSHTFIISSSDGVMSPDSPITSTLCLCAVSTIVCVSTITPRSSTWKPLHCVTTATIFLPISCTSPLTVAIKTVAPGVLAVPAVPVFPVSPVSPDNPDIPGIPVFPDIPVFPVSSPRGEAGRGLGGWLGGWLGLPIYGSSTATAFFITRADFTTCGRNILPSPNSCPTCSIAGIR